MKDELFMKKALEQAAMAAEKGEIPVGAVIVKNGEVLCATHNLCEELHDATAHAEILALRRAGQALGHWLLSGCTLYVTLEPCPMCAAAIAQARPDLVVFGAFDEAMGGMGSVYALHSDARIRSNTPAIGGVLAEASQTLLRAFFSARR
jgi:tRNA(adenine34) deaminase